MKDVLGVKDFVVVNEEERRGLGRKIDGPLNELRKFNSTHTPNPFIKTQPLGPSSRPVVPNGVHMDPWESIEDSRGPQGKNSKLGVHRAISLTLLNQDSVVFLTCYRKFSINLTL